MRSPPYWREAAVRWRRSANWFALLRVPVLQHHLAYPLAIAPLTERDWTNEALAVLAALPRPPRDPGLFSSNKLFGEPGIYPGGSTMVPAPGRAPDADQGAALIVGVAGPSGPSALDCYRDPTMERRIPVPLVRAAAALFVGTVGESLCVSARDRRARIGLGTTASPGRVVGPEAIGSGHPPATVVNERYAGEHPALIMPSLAHSLLWSGPGAGESEEVVLHAVVAVLQAQSIARCPALAHLGTELARRQNSLVITLFNSRHPDEATIRLLVPDGPGTIPGGAPSMQTPDFASIPFVSATDPERPTPKVLHAVLAGIAGPTDGSGENPVANQFDDALVRSWRIGDNAQLTVADRIRVAITLGIFTRADLATIATRVGSDVTSVIAAFDLAAALSCWGD